VHVRVEHFCSTCHLAVIWLTWLVPATHLHYGCPLYFFLRALVEISIAVSLMAWYFGKGADPAYFKVI
jgi:hypothetical protein